jgi:ubiquinone/menaquinone biosynthesis C-methylase UbiE
MDIDELIKNKTEAYFTKYYRDVLGLPDWKGRIISRMNEDENRFAAVVSVKERMRLDFNGLKVLLVGCGTGSDIYPFHKLGAQVSGIDPNEDAITIAQLRARKLGVEPENFIVGWAENMPYPLEEFDFVQCVTVLEHVKDVEKALLEMIRVVRKGRYIYLLTPDYRSSLEQHYKMYLLPKFVPGSKPLNKMLLLLRGRPLGFLDEGINYVDFPQIRKTLIDQPVTFYSTYWSIPNDWRQSIPRGHILHRWNRKLFNQGIQQNIELLIFKYKNQQLAN